MLLLTLEVGEKWKNLQQKSRFEIFLRTAMMPYWNTLWRGLEVTFIFVWGEKTLEWSFSTYTYILENILLQKLLPKMQTLLVVWSIQEESRKALLHLHIRCCVGLGTSRVIRSPCKSTCDHSRVFSHRSKTNVTSSPLQNVFQYGIIAVGKKNILKRANVCKQ